MPASTKPQSTHIDPRRAVSKPASDPTSNASHPLRNSSVSLSHHARKCAICKHPDRQAIDDDFINWRSHHAMAVEYQLPVRSSLYRHAEATGLLARRRRNLRGVAERILEQVADAPPSAASVLRALRIFTQITEDGQWVDPPKRSIVTHIHTHADSPAPDSALSTSPASPNHDDPPNCHSEPARRGGLARPLSAVADGGRGCDEHPTSLPAEVGNLQFDGSTPVTEPVSAEQPRSRTNESESLPIAHFTRLPAVAGAKSSTAADLSRQDSTSTKSVAISTENHDARSDEPAATSRTPSALPSNPRDDEVSTESEAHVAKPPARRAPRGVFYANNGFGPPCPDPLDDFLIATPNKTGEHLSD
jgi:hypothetical protein